jgi:hypothetical protein
LVCSMDVVERFHEAYRAARADPSDEKLLALLEALLPFSPPGVEWGVEVADVAGTTYVLEGGRAVAVRLSRDEFGPFMQTSVAEIPLTSIPAVGLKGLRMLTDSSSGCSTTSLSGPAGCRRAVGRGSLL